MPEDSKPRNPSDRDDLWIEQEPDTGAGNQTRQKDALSSVPMSDPGQADSAGMTANDDTKEQVPTSIVSDSEQRKQPLKKRKQILIACAAAIFIVLSTGTALAYNLWYQNDNKVLGDALLHALAAESLTYDGSYSAKRDDMTLSVDFDGNNPTLMTGRVDSRATLTAGGQTFTLNSSAMIDEGGTLYVKVANVRALFEMAAQALGVEKSAFDGLITKIDEQWVTLAPDETDQVGASVLDNRACFKKTIDTLKDNASQQKELANAYKQHQFISIKNKLTSERIANVQSFGYELTYDSGEYRQFATRANDTQFAIALKACDSSFSFMLDDGSVLLNDDASVTTKVWVSQWSHEVTRVTIDEKTVSENQQSSLSLEPHFNTGTALIPPRNTVTLRELQDEMLHAFAPVLSSSSDTFNASDARALADAQFVIKYTEAFNATNAAYPTLVQVKSNDLPFMSLPADIIGRIGSVAPSESAPGLIQYVQCSGASGARVSYFDSVTRTVETLTAGPCNA